MTTITGGALTQQLYQRLFDRLDVDGNQGLSVDELQAADKTQAAANVAKVFGALDSDADGKIGRAEMTGPAFSFASDTLSALVANQAEAQAEPEPPATSPGGAKRLTLAELGGPPTQDQIEQVAALFARADLDGDGLLSEAERAAEGATRRAANLDTGYISGPIFVMMDDDRDGSISANEVRGGSSTGPVGFSRVKFFDEQSPEFQKDWLDYINDHNARHPDKPMPMPVILSSAEKQRQRDQLVADQVERTSGPPGTTKILSRDLDGLRAAAAQDFTAPITNALSARLMRQLLAAWDAQPARSETVA